MKDEARSKLLRISRLICVSLLIAFALTEALLQLGGRRGNGKIILLNRFSLPCLRTSQDWQKELAPFISPGAESYFISDPDLGWSIKPDTTAADGKVRSNSLGLRSSKEYSLLPSPGVLRIETFGDSFTHGFGVNNDETWPFLLEKALADRGVRAEVLNLGVSGYGTDQSLLHWRKNGRPFRPHIVVLGLNMENTWRNLNLFRPCYTRKAGLLFTKPRAIFDGNGLRFVNLPTVPPSELMEKVVKGFSSWPPSRYEYFGKRPLYSDAILNQSYLISICWELYLRLAGRHPKEAVSNCPEGRLLAEKLLEEFQSDVSRAGATFVLLQLPQRADLRNMRRHGELPYESFLKAAAAKMPLCRTDSVLSIYPYEEILFPADAHPTPKGNRLLAELLSDFLVRNDFRGSSFQSVAPLSSGAKTH